MKIKAAILFEPNRQFYIRELDLEPPRTGEVLVKIAACGVCHSDWHVATGDTKQPMPCVTGHEGSGVVMEVGSGVNHLKVGDPVVLSWTPDCGDCFYCLNNQPNLCETYTAPLWKGVMLDGTPRLSLDGQPVYHYCGLAAFAEYVVVPAPACIKIPHTVPLPVAALIGCAVSTGVGAVIYTAQVRAGESVVVYGVGGIGLSIVQGAAMSGAYPIIALDTNPSKMALAHQFGATHTFLANGDAVTHIRALTAGRGADHVFEAVGLPSVQEAALAAVRPGGQLTLVGLAPMGTGTNLPGAILVRQEITVKGSYYGSVSPRRDFPLLLEWYQRGRLALDQMIGRTYRLEEINTAYQTMLNGDTARGVIVF